MEVCSCGERRKSQIRAAANEEIRIGKLEFTEALRNKSILIDDLLELSAEYFGYVEDLHLSGQFNTEQVLAPSDLQILPITMLYTKSQEEYDVWLVVLWPRFLSLSHGLPFRSLEIGPPRIASTGMRGMTGMTGVTGTRNLEFCIAEAYYTAALARRYYYPVQYPLWQLL